MPKSSRKKLNVREHPPVLSDAARAYAKKVRGDRKLAIRFLKEAGIIEKPGVLASSLRSVRWNQPIAAFTLSGRNGVCRKRTPTASNTALLITAAVGFVEGSPAP